MNKSDRLPSGLPPSAWGQPQEASAAEQNRAASHTYSDRSQFAEDPVDLAARKMWGITSQSSGQAVSERRESESTARRLSVQAEATPETPDATGTVKPGLKGLSKTRALGLKFLALFSKERKEHLKVRQDEHRQFVEARMKSFVDSSHTDVPKEGTPSSHAIDRGLVVVNADELLGQEDLRGPKDRKQIAKLSAQKMLDRSDGLDFDYGAGSNAPELTTKLGKELEKVQSYRFEGVDSVPVPDQVTPTSYLTAEGTTDAEKARLAEERTHLANTYVIEVKDENGKVQQVVIRSGVIDTEQKANDFVALINALIKDIEQRYEGKRPMRIVSQQLNSFDVRKEAKMIDSQHRWIAYANEKLQGKAEVVHINVPSNRWYHTTRAVDSLGALGSLIKAFAPKKMFQGEALSREQNLDSLGAYVKWAADDLADDLNTDKVTGVSQKDRDWENIPAKEKIREVEGQIAIIDNQLKSPSLRPAEKRRLEDRLYALQADLNIHRAGVDLPVSYQGVEKTEIKFCRGALATLKGNSTTRATLKQQADKLITTIEKAKPKIKDKDLPPQERADNKRALKKATAELKETRKKLRELLEKDDEALEVLEPHLLKGGAAYIKVSLMRQVLGSQLKLEGRQLDRGKEGMALQLLNDQLGVSSALNCKSGLDRTGLWHAVKMGMLSLRMDPEYSMKPAQQFNLVNNWETTTKLMNKLSARYKPTGPEDPQTFDAWLSDTKKHGLPPKLRRLLPKDADEGALLKEMRHVAVLRREVLKNLLDVGVPITTISTGVAGLKWNNTQGVKWGPKKWMKGKQENLIPLNFLPAHALVIGTDGIGRNVPLVKYGSNGEPSGMTLDGARLLTKFQTYRGS